MDPGRGRASYGVAAAADLRGRLPGRSASAVWTRAHKLGLMASQAPPWSAAEDEALAAAYAEGCIAMHQLLARLPGRTALAIRSRAVKAGLTRRDRFTPEETRQVARLVHTHEPAAVAEAVYGSASAENVARVKQVTASRQLLRVAAWTPEVRRRVAEMNRAGATDAEIVAAMPGLFKSRRQVNHLRRDGLQLPGRWAALLDEARGAKAERRAEFAGRYGLPPDLSPTQVAVVVVLAGGPRTTAELKDLFGRARLGHANLSQLCGAGLVATVRTRLSATHTLTAHAMDLLSRAGGSKEAP